MSDKHIFSEAKIFQRFSPIIRNEIYTYLAIFKAYETSKLICDEGRDRPCSRIYHNFVQIPTRVCCMCWEIPKGYVVCCCSQSWTIRYVCQNCLNHHYGGDKYLLANDFRDYRRYSSAFIEECQFGDLKMDPYFRRIEFVRCPRCKHYCHPEILYKDGCLQFGCLDLKEEDPPYSYF